MPPDDPRPDPSFIAGIDQLAQIVKEQARVVGSYYKALIEQGFSEDQAFTLTLAYQAAFMTPK